MNAAARATEKSTVGAPRTRRSLLGLAGLAPLTAACSVPWSHPLDRLRIVPLPGATPVGFGTPTIRVVLAQEGLPALDGAVRQLVADAGRRAGATVEVQDTDAFLGTAAPRDTLAHRLLSVVQAGTPPDALLVLGRQAQTARLHAMELVQDVSGLMRTSRQRYGNVPPVTEVWHVVAGNWFAVPYYQRLIGHWLRAERLPETSLDLGGDVKFEQLAQTFATPLAEADRNTAGAAGAGSNQTAAAGALWRWGIGAADTADVDAWCWDVIHAFGGALADRTGERVQIGGPETIAALEWLRRTFAALAMRGQLPPAAGRWRDDEKNAAFLAGSTDYTFTDRLLGPASDAGMPSPVYLPAPAGPVNRPSAAGGGAAWYVPRGAPAPLVERLLERLLDLPAQQALWRSSGGGALPAFETGWSEVEANGAGAGGPAGGANASRFHQELADGGLASATGNAGPETAASQAVAEGRLAAAMLRAMVSGRPASDVAAEAQESAIGVFRDFGLQGT